MIDTPYFKQETLENLSPLLLPNEVLSSAPHAVIITDNVNNETTDKNSLSFPVIAKETLKSKPKFLLQAYDHSGKVLNDGSAEPAPSNDF